MPLNFPRGSDEEWMQYVARVNKQHATDIQRLWRRNRAAMHSRDNQQALPIVNPSVGECLWQWDDTAQQWNLIDSLCSYGCGCKSPPENPGAEHGETATTPCEVTGRCIWEWDGTNVEWKLIGEDVR